MLLAPLWFDWEDGGFSIVVWANDIKSRCLERDPRATVLVADPEPPYQNVEICGEATVTKPDDLQARVLSMAIRYLGEEGGAEYAASFEGVDLELVRLVPGIVRAWDFRDDFEQS